jgi:two-component system, chemotaxis family, response regulator Rcp1
MIEYPILLVEDNPDDVLITQRAFKKGMIKNKLYTVENGIEALKFLHKEEEYSDAPVPALILLDINMPLMNGFQVLEKIKNDDELQKIPVIMLTTSERDSDIEKAYSLGCNSYIVKPVNFQKFLEVVVNAQEYWLKISKIPVK